MRSTASPVSEGRLDSGNAIAEYVMVLALAILLFAGIVQLGFALHVRNTLIDAAASGARYAGLADRSDADGVARTQAIIADAVGSSYAQDVNITRTRVGSLPAVEITVVAPLPVMARFGPPESLTVSGHAVALD